MRHRNADAEAKHSFCVVLKISGTSVQFDSSAVCIRVHLHRDTVRHHDIAVIEMAAMNGSLGTVGLCTIQDAPGSAQLTSLEMQAVVSLQGPANSPILIAEGHANAGFVHRLPLQAGQVRTVDETDARCHLAPLLARPSRRHGAGAAVPATRCALRACRCGKQAPVF